MSLSALDRRGKRGNLHVNTYLMISHSCQFSFIARSIELIVCSCCSKFPQLLTMRSGNVHWIVPKITNTLFTGREDILEKLDRSIGPQSDPLQMSQPQKRFVIIGDGGIGKSEICLKFANEHRQQ